MSQPLSPLSFAALNISPPGTAQKSKVYGTIDHRPNGQNAAVTPSIFDGDVPAFQGPPSSPFVVEPEDRVISPRKFQSPSKTRSPMKSPIKFMPSSRKENETPRTGSQSTDSGSSWNEDDSILQYGADGNEEMSRFGGKPGYDTMDETTFSTFSAVPNTDMTTFAQLGRRSEDYNQESPSKQLQLETYARYSDSGPSPSRQMEPSTPGTVRRQQNLDHSPSPTPRRRDQRSGTDETTNLILDFTEQFNAFSTVSSRNSPSRNGRRSPTKSQTQPDLAAFVSRGRTPSPRKRAPQETPSGYLANLLDFDIPPAPTPRSVPSISARELESLKSGYLSEISSLKATLSGKTAEVNSLKDAVGDAERRVGEAMETLRDMNNARQSAMEEKESWEKRGKEMETVLRSVKEGIIREEREKERLATKLEESERKREEAETKAAEADSRIAGMRAASASTTTDDGSNVGSVNSSKEVEAAVEKVARELHALYKSKHETKVSALKKSYETRWGKRVSELADRLEEVNKENEELRTSRDVTLSGVIPRIPSTGAAEAKHQKERAEDLQRHEEQKAKLLGLTEEMSCIKHDNSRLVHELEMERAEKGDLVAAVEEMLNISAAAQAGDVAASSGLENLRGSIRASGLKRPDYSSIASAPSLGSNPGSIVESRIGRMNSTGSVGKPHSRSGSALSGGISAPRSGIMSNIERMGRGRAE